MEESRSIEQNINNNNNNNNNDDRISYGLDAD